MLVIDRVYRELTELAFYAAEKSNVYHALTEKHLQVLWLEQKYFRSLLTLEKENIQVISPGIWNVEAGPDFFKAHLKIGSEEYRGDIEIHLIDEEWYRHQHHLDKRYNSVVLHLSFKRSNRNIPLIKENGQSIKQAYLEDFLKQPIQDLISLIDLDLYPHQIAKSSGRCSHQLFQQLPKEETISFFQSASYWRLKQKKQTLQAHFANVDLQLAGGLAMALGYKHNAQAFLELFCYLYENRHLSEKELLAMALGCCGFFDSHAKPKWECSTEYIDLRLLWWGQRSEVIHQTHLRLDRIRPLNHPIRRLVYLTKLLQDSALDELWQRMWQAWAQMSLTLTSKQLLQQLLDKLPVYEDPYWNYHLIFEEHPQAKYQTLMGSQLKAEVLVNVILPLLYHEILQSQNGYWQQQFQTLYASVPASVTSKSQYLTQRFFGEQSSEELLKTAQLEQGAYQLHKDFCLHFEASCEGCPFVERYSRFTLN